MTNMQWLSIFEHAGIWAGVIVPILFFIQYTMLAKWWKNAVGRSIVALDFCLELVMAPLWIALVFPRFELEHTLLYEWILVAGICGVPIVALYRMCSWEKLRRARKSVGKNGRFLHHEER